MLFIIQPHSIVNVAIGPEELAEAVSLSEDELSNIEVTFEVNGAAKAVKLSIFPLTFLNHGNRLVDVMESVFHFWLHEVDKSAITKAQRSIIIWIWITFPISLGR